MKKFIYTCVLVSLISLFCPTVFAEESNDDVYTSLQKIVSSGDLLLSLDNPYADFEDLYNVSYTCTDGTTFVYTDLFTDENINLDRFGSLSADSRNKFLEDVSGMLSALCWETEHTTGLGSGVSSGEVEVFFNQLNADIESSSIFTKLSSASSISEVVLDDMSSSDRSAIELTGNQSSNSIKDNFVILLICIVVSVFIFIVVTMILFIVRV